MADIVLVHGTFARGSTWHRDDAPLPTALRARGHIVHPFKWSGILAGVPSTRVAVGGDDPDERFGDAQLLPWLDAGEKLVLFCHAHELVRPHVVSHSHGLQVVMFAANKGQLFGTLIDLSGPVRRDMLRVRRAAMGNFQRIMHVVDPQDDRVIEEGEFFDGHLGFKYDLPEAHENLYTPGSGHSGMCTDLARWDALDFWSRLA